MTSDVDYSNRVGEYRAKYVPVIIAMRFTGTNLFTIGQFVKKYSKDYCDAGTIFFTKKDGLCNYGCVHKEDMIYCLKLDSMVVIHPGDYIILEPDGKGVYPCVQSIFEEKYECMRTVSVWEE